jgi:hypothetical protein
VKKKRESFTQAKRRYNKQNRDKKPVLYSTKPPPKKKKGFFGL